MENLLMDDTLAQIKDEILKAAETIATSTWDPAARSVFSPENLDEKIKLLVPVDTPLRNRLPRVKGYGQAAAWKKMTSKLHSNVADSGTATTIFFADAGAPGETPQTYSVTSATYKLLGRKLEVGGLALAASKGVAGQPDMQQSRENIKMYELMLGEEEAIIAGDTDNAAIQFDGILKQITTNSGAVSLVSASGVGTYCQTLYNAGAVPTALVINGRQCRGLADDLQGTGSIQRIVVDNQGRGIGGIRLAEIVNPIDGTLIDVLASRYVGGTGMLLTERSPAGENWIEMDDLIPVSRIDVPSSNFSYISFIIEATVLKVMGEPFQYQFAGLATS